MIFSPKRQKFSGEEIRLRKSKFEFFEVDFSAVPGLKRKKNSRWLKLAIQTKIQLCVLPKFDENHHVRSGVFFTPKVKMKHVDRGWKAYSEWNKGESPEFKCGVAK